MPFIKITEEDALQSGRHIHNLMQDKFEQGYIEFSVEHHPAVGMVITMCTVEDFVDKLHSSIKAKESYLLYIQMSDRDEPDENYAMAP